MCFSKTKIYFTGTSALTVSSGVLPQKKTMGAESIRAYWLSNCFTVWWKSLYSWVVFIDHEGIDNYVHTNFKVYQFSFTTKRKSLAKGLVSFFLLRQVYNNCNTLRVCLPLYVVLFCLSLLKTNKQSNNGKWNWHIPTLPNFAAILKCWPQFPPIVNQHR